MYSGLQGDTSYVSCAKLHRFLLSLRDFTLKMSETANFSALDVADAKGAPFPCCHYFLLESPFFRLSAEQLFKSQLPLSPQAGSRRNDGGKGRAESGAEGFN